MKKELDEGKMTPLQKDVKNVKIYLKFLAKKYPEYRKQFMSASHELESIKV